MGYVPGYKYDIFVSYASANNQAIDEKNNKGLWVTKSKERLEKFLDSFIQKNKFSLWFDEGDILTGDRLNREISQALRESATLLIFLSKAYLHSDWCKYERDEFERVQRFEFIEDINTYMKNEVKGIPGDERIFVLRMEKDIPEEHQLPKLLRGVHYLDIYDKQNTSIAYCFPDLDGSEPDIHEYTRLMDTLGTHIYKKLKKLKERIETRPNHPELPPRQERTTDDLKCFYDDCLKNCDGLVIIYGGTTNQVVTMVLSKCDVLVKNEDRKRRYEAGALIEPPPPDIEREVLSFIPGWMEEINCKHKIARSKIKKFLKSVKKSFDEDIQQNPARNPYPRLFIHAVGTTDKKIADEIRTMGKADAIEVVIHDDKRAVISH